MLDAISEPAASGVSEQRRRALAQANRTRGARKDLKSALRDGTLQLADVLAAPPEWLLSAPVRELLLATPTIGTVRATRLLDRAHIGFTARVGALTERQRDALLARI